MTVRSRTLLWWLGGAGLWTGFALLEILESTLSNGSPRPAPTHRQYLVLDRLIDWYSYGVFVPLLIVATHRWPLDRAHVGTRLPLHLALIVATVLGRNAIVRPLFNGEPPHLSGGWLAANLITETIAIAALDGVAHAIVFYRRYRDREALTLQLRASLSDARLHALRAQLNPHFLFNTLNAATALLYRDPRGADRMLTALADLLRVTLRTSPTHETSLREEMAVLQRYLDIMAVRFSDRVTVGIDIDPGVVDALVPSLLLQPIVENAFEHGVSNLDRKAHVQIEARREQDRLALLVRDDGRGFGDEAPAKPSGVGLSNTRRRLAELYGGAATLELTSIEGRGALVRVHIPLRLEVVPA